MNKKIFPSIVLLGMSLSACQLPQPQPTVIPLVPEQPTVAIVMGEGYARSFAHIGVMRVLEKEKIHIDMIVGSGLGAVMAAFYARQKSSFDMEWHALQMEKKNYLQKEKSKKSESTLSLHPLSEFLKTKFQSQRIGSFKVPLIVTTLDFRSGKILSYKDGATLPILLASCSTPGLFPSVTYQGKALVSSEIALGIPIEVAIQNGADFIIAIDVNPEDLTKTSELQSPEFQSAKISALHLSREQLDLAHVVIEPEVSHIGDLEFEKRREALLAGIKATEAKIDEIKELLQDWQSP